RPGPLGSFGIVSQFPIVNVIGRDEFRADTFAALDLADDTCVRAPAARAILQVAMKTLAATIDARHQCIWSTPFIQSLGVEEAQQEVVWTSGDKYFTRGAEGIFKSSRFGQPVAVVGRFA